MLKENRKYIIILLLCFFTLILIEFLSPKPINWKLSYLKKDKIPYGTSALHSSLITIFPGQHIETKTMPLFNSLYGNGIKNCNYIIINQSFEPDKLDNRELLKFVSRGNNAFIAANYFSGKFADTLKLKTDNYYGLKNGITLDSAAFKNVSLSHDTVRINFVTPSLKAKVDYLYAKGMDNTYFNSFDTSKTTVLGGNAEGKINFIRMRFGEGNFYLSALPEAFSNYHFVHKTNFEYVYKALSYLPITKVLWDEYYKVGVIKQESPLRVIFNNSVLLTTYYIVMLSLILFIIFGIKRKQRIIPVIDPLRNTTLDFVDIIGTLYYQDGNHKNIADKKISYFLDFIRSTFQVKTTLYDDKLIERISNLSGIEKQEVHDLFYYFSEIGFKENITQNELLKLNGMIETFHAANKR